MATPENPTNHSITGRLHGFGWGPTLTILQPKTTGCFPLNPFSFCCCCCCFCRFTVVLIQLVKLISIFYLHSPPEPQLQHPPMLRHLPGPIFAVTTSTTEMGKPFTSSSSTDFPPPPIPPGTFNANHFRFGFFFPYSLHQPPALLALASFVPTFLVHRKILFQNAFSFPLYRDLPREDKRWLIVIKSKRKSILSLHIYLKH